MIRQIASLRSVVLGGGGFLGSNLCYHLANKVHYLRAFGRNDRNPSLPATVEWMKGNFDNSRDVAQAIEGCDTVFHLISSSTPASSNADMIGDLQTNAINSLRLLDACRIAKVRRVVFVSSGGTVYGRPSHLPTHEESSTLPISAYGVTKLTIEQYLFLYEYLYGLEYCILRVANPFGPLQYAYKGQGVIAAVIERVLASQPIEIWGDGSVKRDFVYVDDVSRALEAAAIYDGAERIFNVGSGVARSLNEVVSSIQAAVGAKVIVTHLAERSLDVPISLLDITRAKVHLSWWPIVSFEQGLIQTIEWMRECRSQHV